MTILKYILLALLFVLLTGAAIVRVKPLDAATLHVDPAAVEGPSVGHALIGQDGSVVVSGSKAEVADALEQIILATPRTQKLAGDLAESYATYVTRSAVFAFPDAASVRLAEVEGGVAVTIFSRQLVGVKDFGVNAERVASWIEALRSR